MNVGKADAETPSSPETFALQARHFSELRLLNRELEVSVHGAASGSGKGGGEGSLLVTANHPKVPPSSSPLLLLPSLTQPSPHPFLLL